MEADTIKPYHLFYLRDRYYMIDIEAMSAVNLDQDTAEALNKLSPGPGSCLDASCEAVLEKAGLLPGAAPKATAPRVIKEPGPVQNLCLLLTQSCNLRCTYCYGDGGTYGTGGEMDQKTAFQAVDWLMEQSGKVKKLRIGFFGGEPFLKFSLMKAVVKYAQNKAGEYDKKVEFHCTTNATLLDEERIAFIKETPVQVMVSFDGLKELQDKHRPYADGRGSYHSTLPRIKQLLAEMPGTHGHAVAVGDTSSQRIKDSLQEIGFSTVSVIPASPSLFAEGRDREEAPQFLDTKLQELEQEADKWIELTCKREAEALKALLKSSELKNALIYLLHNRKSYHACGAGLGLVAVSCTGEIYLCHRFVGKEEYQLGNIFDQELQREPYLESPVKCNELCSNCFARYYCAGGCKHENAGTCGSFSVPAKGACQIRCKELELAAYVICNLSPEEIAFLMEQEVLPPKPCLLDF